MGKFEKQNHRLNLITEFLKIILLIVKCSGFGSFFNLRKPLKVSRELLGTSYSISPFNTFLNLKQFPFKELFFSTKTHVSSLLFFFFITISWFQRKFWGFETHTFKIWSFHKNLRVRTIQYQNISRRGFSFIKQY